MPSLTRPDGAELHWDEHGEGPPVVFPLHWTGHPRLAAPLIDTLGDEYRVLVVHRRGQGESSRRGPYDAHTDAGDLEAVLETAAPDGAVLVAMANAANDAIRAGAARPDGVAAVVISGALPLGQGLDFDPGEALAGSRSVLTTMTHLLETSFRAGLRSMLSSGNPDYTEGGVQKRVDEVVEFCERDSSIGRLRSWIADDVSAEALALGDRLWWLTTTTNPWYPDDLAEQLPALLPEAHIGPVVDGPVNRPDITAAIVRGITAGA